jgi:FKBP-type peptidyl-prolyl cis-trans isomerase FklB
MKRNLPVILGLGLAALVLPAAAQPPGGRPPGALPPASTNDYSKIFKDDKERNGYAIGMFYGKNGVESLKGNDLPFDTNAMINGFTDGINGNTNRIDEDQFRDIIGILRREMHERMMEKQKQMQEKQKADAEKNKKDGEAFLAAKKNEPGVIPLPSGLMYKVITEGSGASPKAADSVTVNYRGTLIDGTEFDSSAKTGKPATFRVGGVIKGWTEALQLMKPGAKWVLYIPSDLAYGEHGSPPKIGGNSVLVFEVELISVQPAPTASIAPSTAPTLTSDIIKVPSAEELKKGAKIETIKAEDIEKERQKEAAAANTNK